MNAQQRDSETSPFPTSGLEAHEALEYRKRFRGMIGVSSKVPIKDRSVLSLVYTPGVAPALAAAVAQAAMDSGVARLRVDPQLVAKHCHDFVYEGLLTPVPPLEELHS